MSSEKKPEKGHGQEHEKPETPGEGKKSLKKWIIIGSIIALVIIIISAGAFFFFKKKSHDKAGAEHSKEEKKEKEEKPKEEAKKGEGEPIKPDEKSFFPAIFFSERLTLPIKLPVKEGEEKVKKSTLKKDKEEQVKEGQEFLIIRLALEFESEEKKKAFEEVAPEFLRQFGAVIGTKNKDELLQFSGKIKLKLELSRIAEKVTDGKTRPKNIFFTDFTIQ